MSAVEAHRANDELIVALSGYNMLKQLELSLKLNNVTLKNYMSFRDQLIAEEGSEELGLRLFNSVIGRFVVCVLPSNGRLYLLHEKVESFPTPDSVVQINCMKKSGFKFSKLHSSSKRLINNEKLKIKKSSCLLNGTRSGRSDCFGFYIQCPVQSQRIRSQVLPCSTMYVATEASVSIWSGQGSFASKDLLLSLLTL